MSSSPQSERATQAPAATLSTQKHIFSLILSSVDQAVLSLTSFLISLLMVRYATKAEFALFSMALGILLLLLSIQNAAVLTPITVLLPEKTEEHRRPFIRSLMRVQLVSVLPLSMIVCSLWLVTEGSGLTFSEAAAIVSSFAVAASGVLLREFTRSIQYARLKPGKALLIDVIYSVCVCASLATIARLAHLNLVTTFITMGLTAFAAVLWGNEEGLGLGENPGPIESGLESIRETTRLAR